MRTKVVFAAALLLVSCGRKKDVQLPPAQGPGAAALPALPIIPQDDKANSADRADREKAAIVAPTEGRTTGTTFPRAEAQIGPKGAGLIEKVFVAEGARVKRGMVLFRQETRDAELRVEQARAGREAARVSLKATETELARGKLLFDKSALSRMDWDQMQSRTDGARVGVQQADVAFSMAEKALADATVHSPIDGVVTAKLKSEGEMATMMPPTVILVVQDQSTLELRFHLPEKALLQVRRGDVVTARFDALGTTRQAKVARINSALDARTRTVEVVAEIPNRDGSLKSGLLAEVLLGGGQPSVGAGGETASRDGTQRAAR